MAKRKPKHLAPVAATKSDINGGLARIIELATKWHAILQWTQTLKAAKDFRRYRCEVSVLSAMIGEHGVTPDDVQKYRSLSEERHKQVTYAQQELLELQNLVRQYAPALLECVPDVDFGMYSENESDFFLDFPEVDHSPLRRELRKLEGQASVLSQRNLNPRHEEESQRPDVPKILNGISLFDAALVLNEFDSTAANETKERWKKHRTQPPKPLGKAANHKQTDLFDPERLRDEYLAIVEPDLSSAFIRKAYKGKLRPVRQTGETGRKVAVKENSDIQ